MARRTYNWTRWLAAVGFPAGAATLIASRFVGDGVLRAHWAWQAVLSGSFLFAAGVTILSAVVLVLLLVAMWRGGHAARSAGAAQRGQDGTAMIEFAMVFPIALMMVLLMVQGTLLMAGNLCIHYAAFCAARAAATSVPLDYSPNEAPNVVDLGNPDGSAKLRRMKMSAVYATMPVSCGAETLPDVDIVLKQSLRDYFTRINQSTPHWVESMIGRKWGYAEAHTTIDLAPPIDAVRPVYGPSEDLSVRVTHEFYLAVPYARRIFSMGNDGLTVNVGGGTDFATRIRAFCRLPNEGVQDFVDVETFP